MVKNIAIEDAVEVPYWVTKVALAEHYLAVDQAKQWLSPGEGEYWDKPWHLVDSVRVGGGYRLGIETGLYIEAYHPSGLRFHWRFEIEPREANGTGTLQVDVVGLKRLYDVLPDEFKPLVRDHVRKVSEKIAEEAKRTFDYAIQEFGTVAVLTRLFGELAEEENHGA